MQFCVILFILASFVYAENEYDAERNIGYSYHVNVGIPQAERIRKYEENLGSRIVGGVPAVAGQYPFQAGIIGDIVGITGISVCNGALVSPSRVVTAAHCWNDGVHQAWRLTIVLGTSMLFSGGTRVMSSAVATHPNWSPILGRNDVAVVFLSAPLSVSNTIAPIALPSGSELFDNFAGQPAIAVGFGVTRDGESLHTGLALNHIRLNVIGNSVCSLAFPLLVQLSNICTSGVGGVGTCTGDSGSPLIVMRNNRPILVGIAQNFRSDAGCQAGLPSVFARVTSFMDFFNRHI